MTLKIVHRLLLAGYSITFAFYVDNTNLDFHLRSLAQNFAKQLTLYPSKICSGHIQGVMSFIQWLDLYRLYRLIKGKFDVICASQGNFELSSKILLTAKLARVKLISYIPGDFTPSSLGLPFAWLRDIFVGILLRLPDSYISISPSFVNGLRHKVDTDVKRVYLLENIIDLNSSIVLPIFREFIPPIRLLVVGAINPVKNQGFILDWLERNPGFICELTLVGSGELLPSIEKRVLATASLRNRIKILGWCEDTQPLILNADLLLIPSLIEGVPLVMLEAAALGVPILATNAYGMADFLPLEMRFEINDFIDFSRKLKYLLDHPNECQRLVRLNYQRVVDFNDHSTFNDQVLTIFDDFCFR